MKPPIVYHDTDVLYPHSKQSMTDNAIDLYYKTKLIGNADVHHRAQLLMHCWSRSPRLSAVQASG